MSEDAARFRAAILPIAGGRPFVFSIVGREGQGGE
jgi:hypothetical protein